MTNRLTVYQASAGSGKTFTLAAEYISLLVRNPQAYRHILAVTFTNKATEEMKSRILSQLYGISKGLRMSNKYLKFVIEKTGYEPEFIRQRAGQALVILLHNYSYFRVETIDSFFQSVMRNLARELDLAANLRIGLNDTQVEELAVDQMIDDLSTKDVRLKWIMQYIMDSIEDDRSWNVISQIKSFGKTIFRDYYKESSKKLADTIADPSFFTSYSGELRHIRDNAKATMTALGNDFFSTLQREGIEVSDLAYGERGIAAMFSKLQNGIFDASIITKRVTEFAGEPEKWCSKTQYNRDKIVHLAATSLGDILHQAIQMQPLMWSRYQSAVLTLRHLNQLRLLEGIEQKVNQINSEQNRFLLSNTQQLLHDIIDGSDSPFIFEKIGTQLEHIMIDEFQDTSTVQWQNFKVLLQETMSHEDSNNLIVGDVKQSIYRWRSGDWRLLAGIKDEFPNYRQAIKEVPLKFNRRSCPNIIRFNNAFFSIASGIEGVDAYKEVEQLVPEGKPASGMVNVALLPADDYTEETLRRTASIIDSLISQGARQSDIAILVRKNAHIPLIAEYVMKQVADVNIVSDEAFRLDASPAVMMIISTMRWLVNPDDTISKAYIASAVSERPLHDDAIDTVLPAQLTEGRDDMLRLPLPELVERTATLLGLYKMEGQVPFLCAFHDKLTAAIDGTAIGIVDFLHEWDSNISHAAIEVSGIDGIRIVSIHRSKGLEFAHVIIPFADWKMEMKDILWCKPKEEPFSKLPIVPVDFSKKGMTGTIYEDHYKEEHSQNTVDNLNLLYVAFTRASNNLFVIGKRKSPASRSGIIESVLPKVADELKAEQPSNLNDESQPIEMTFGSLTFEREEEKDEDKETNVFLPEATPIIINIEPSSHSTEFRQSNQSRLFAIQPDDNEDGTEAEEQQRYIRTGTVLHNILATVRTAADIPQALDSMEFDGILYDDRLTRDRLRNLIAKRLSHPKVADWFSPKWQLYNECTLLDINPDTHRVYERRPDRVMTDGKRTIVVDFKFGHKDRDHLVQVEDYMNQLRRMGHNDIEGYLWYVYSNEIIDVNKELQNQ